MFHIISNPKAGKKKSRKVIEIVKEIFGKRGVDYTLYETQEAGDGTKFAKQASEEGATDFIVVGGDGTVNEVLNGLKEPEKCRLGIVPAGTGNDFVEAVGIPMDPQEAVLNILDGEALETDYLTFGDVRCMNIGGLGIDVDVLERCRRGKMHGKLKYITSLITSLFTFKGVKVSIEEDGEMKERNTLLVACCNGKQFGGGIPICPAAKSDDGKMDAMIVDCIGGKWKIIKAFLALMKGKVLDLPITTHFLCERLRLVPASPCTVQLDGELYRDLSFDVTLKKGLQFYRP